MRRRKPKGAVASYSSRWRFLRFFSAWRRRERERLGAKAADRLLLARSLARQLHEALLAAQAIALARALVLAAGAALRKRSSNRSRCTYRVVHRLFKTLTTARGANNSWSDDR
jgi:hypothetical protein